MSRKQTNTTTVNNNGTSVDLFKWAPLLILLVTAIVYSNALHNGLTSFDDDFYIEKNPYLKDYSWSGIKAIFSSFYSSNYHPLTTLTFFFEYHFFALDPFPYHLLNVILHLVNTWLVFELALRLSGNKITATVVSSLFGLHPMHVESVAWVAERKDVLYSFFFLSSSLFYIRYSDTRKRSDYIISLSLFLCSCLSKSAAVTLPVVFILIDWFRGRGINARTIMEKIPFLAFSVLFGILNILAQAAGGSINDIVHSLGILNRPFIVTGAISSYLFRLFIPYKLSGMHYFPVLTNGFLPWEYYLSFGFVSFLAIVVLRSGSFRRQLVFGSLFFLITIALMLQVVSVGSAVVAERYTYISYIGLFYIIGELIASLWSTPWRNLAAGVFTLCIVAYSVQSYARIGIWKDDTVLFNDMIEKNPNVYFGYWMRGNFEKKDGDVRSALQDYNKAIELNATFEDAYYNRGVILDAIGDHKAAVNDYTHSIRLNPKLSDAYNNRGWALFMTGDTAAAINDISKAIAIKPLYAEAYNNRGWIYASSGNNTAAISDYDKAISIDPGFLKPRYNRASLRGNVGNYNGALEDFNFLANVNPNDNSIYYFRGITKLMLKDTSSACADFSTARNLGNTSADQLISQFCH